MKHTRSGHASFLQVFLWGFRTIHMFNCVDLNRSFSCSI